VARILYAMPAWGPHLNVAQTSRINSFLKRAYKCGFSEELLTVEPLLHSSATCLFNKMHQSTHCLHNLLPSVKALEYSLLNSQAYSLPQCKYQLFKRSFVNWCLFSNLQAYINFHISHCVFLVFCIFPFFCVVLLLFTHI